MDRQPLTPPTPHNAAKKGDFASFVIMPGDPKRSQWIAESFLENPQLVNDVRGVQGYTGLYKGKRVSVMASMMGMPSMALYSHELFSAYGVRAILRIGTSGAVSPSVRAGDAVASLSCFTNSGIVSAYGLDYQIAPTCSYPLLRLAEQAAKKLQTPLIIGSTSCKDLYYEPKSQREALSEFGVLCSDMESAALYIEAMRQKAHALSLMAVVEDARGETQLGADERHGLMTALVNIALETALAADSDTLM